MTFKVTMEAPFSYWLEDDADGSLWPADFMSREAAMETAILLNRENQMRARIGAEPIRVVLTLTEDVTPGSIVGWAGKKPKITLDSYKQKPPKPPTTLTVEAHPGDEPVAPPPPITIKVEP